MEIMLSPNCLSYCWVWVFQMLVCCGFLFCFLRHFHSIAQAALECAVLLHISLSCSFGRCLFGQIIATSLSRARTQRTLLPQSQNTPISVPGATERGLFSAMPLGPLVFIALIPTCDCHLYHSSLDSRWLNFPWQSVLNIITKETLPTISPVELVRGC